MTLQPGYKQTEVGVIPEDWDDKSLGELGDTLIGLTYKPSDVREYGILVLRASNIQDNALAFDDNVFVNCAVPERIMVCPGDVLICVRNGSRELIGKTAYLDERARGMTFGAFMAVHRGRTGKLVSYLFQSEILKRQIREHLGATINQITNKSLNSFRIPLPPTKSEQRAIAAALSDMDALLGALDRLIAKQRDIKQAAMQQLLTGQTRLPGFSGEWERVMLGKLEQEKAIRLYRGKVISQRDIERNPGSYPIYSSSVHDDGLFGNYGDYMLDEELITWSVDGGGHFFYRPKHRFSVTNVCGYMRILSDNLSCRFLVYALQELHSHKTFDYTMKAHPSVIRNEYLIPIPTLPEQTAIAAVLSDMDAEIAALEARRAKTRDLKQAMMQELLTGRVRLVAREAAKNAKQTP